MPDWLYNLLSVTGIAALARHILVQRGRFVLVFHGVTGQKEQKPPGFEHLYLTVAELDGILRWVRRRFQWLTPEQLLESDQPGVLLTFDDGMANNYTYAVPVLERHDAPALFFVSTQHVMDPRNWLQHARHQAQVHWQKREDIPEAWAGDLFDGMSAEQVAACASHPLITIASHTISHPYLTRCSESQLTHELLGSRRQLESITAQTVDLFAYPSGDYDVRVAQAVRAAGYRAAFALQSSGAGMPLYEIPRVGIYRPSIPYLNVRLSGLHKAPLRSYVGSTHRPKLEVVSQRRPRGLTEVQ